MRSLTERPVGSTAPTLVTPCSSTSTTSLGMLPDDQRQHVLSYLTCSELLTLTLVSKAVKSIALRSHTLVSIQTNHHGSNSGAKNDNNIVNLHNHKRDSLLRKSIVMNTANLDPFSSHPRIHQSQEGRDQDHHGFITERNLFHLLQRFQSLRTLKLHNFTCVESMPSSSTATATTTRSRSSPSPVDNNIFQIINSSPSAFTLTHIEIHNIRLIQNNHTLSLPNHQNQNLHTLILSGMIFSHYDPVIQSILSGCSNDSNLTKFELNGLRSVTDTNIQHMNKFFLQNSSKINHVSLQNCSKLTSPYIQSSTLRYLNLSQCPLLSDLRHIKCEQLQIIDVSSCHLINDESVHCLLVNCPMLEEVMLTTCSCLNGLNIKSRRLKKLNLNLCINLKSVNVDCENMTHLEVCRINYIFVCIFCCCYI